MIARLLDVSRLASRAGRGLTGVDRVEMAYLDGLLRRDDPLWGLARVRGGLALLDRDGLEGLRAKVLSGGWGPPDAIARLPGGHSGPRARAEADLRRLALAWRPFALAGRMLNRRLPAGVRYLNVGHANLTPRTFGAVRAVPGARVAVLLHDAIPLDRPDWQRAGTAARFAGALRLVARVADLCLYNSAHSRARCEAHMAPGRVPPGLVAHLGVEVAEAAAPPEGTPDGPYFVALGTIEPRKNHAFLLDLWEGLPEPRPALVIAGARGWRNEAVFARLDARPAGVVEMPGLSDGEVAALLDRSCGLLFPSLMEGFGLPPAEALARGVRVLCNPLDPLREFLGPSAVYASVDEPYLWRETIIGWAANRDRVAPAAMPTWDGHLNAVLSRT